MDGQHQYEINLKKDDLFISLSSDDVYFISKQMDKWFSILLDDSYVPVSMPQRPPMPEPAASVPISAPMEVPTNPTPLPQQEIPVAPAMQPVQAMPEAGFIHPAQAQIPQAQPMPAAQAMPTAESNEQLAQQIMMQQQQAMLQAQPNMPQVPSALPEQPNIPDFVPQQAPIQAPAMAGAPATNTYQDVNLPMSQAPAMAQQQPQSVAAMPQAIPHPMPQQFQPEPAPQAMPPAMPQMAAPEAPALISNPQQDDFEAVMNTLLRDFEDKPMETPNFANAQNGFTEHVEPDLTGVTSLSELCDRSNAVNSEDYLLLSAYYLTRLERHDKFSLKKVNSALVKSGLTPVNHSVLQTVLSNGYLAMLPDLTGTAEVTEYQISHEGVAAAIALL